MDPTNYWGQVDLSQIPSVTGPLQAYQAAQQQSAARAVAAAQLQRQQQQQAIGDAAFRDAITNPNPKSYAALAIARPEVFQSAVAAHKMQDDDQQQSTVRSLSAVNGYLQAKQPDQALGVLDQYITAAKAAGRDTAPYEAFANSIKTNPGVATAMSGGMLAALAGPDKYAEAYGKIGDEGRALTAEPGKEDLTAAQAIEARAKAKKDGFITVKDAAGNDAIVSVDALSGAQGAAPAGPGAATAAAPVPANAPRGVRNNNPLNVQPLPDGQWEGQTGTDGRYATFATPEAGLAAADKNLQAYGLHHGINTIAGVINRWAPQGDGTNDPVAYAKAVAKDLGIPPSKPIDLSDPAIRQKLLQSMAKVESPGATVGESGAAPAGNEMPGVVFKTPGYGDVDSSGALSPAGVEMVGTQYLRLGPDALKNLGQGKTGVQNKAKILNWASQAAAEAGTSNPELVLRFVQNKANIGALTQVQKNLSMITASEATLGANADLVMKYAKKGVGPTGQPWLDTPINAIRRAGGSVAAKDLDNVMTTTANEYAKILTTTTGTGGGATSDSARKEAHDLLNSGMTLRQMIGAIDIAKQEAANRHAANAHEVARLGAEISGTAPPVAPSAPVTAPAAGGWGKAVVVRH